MVKDSLLNEEARRKEIKKKLFLILMHLFQKGNTDKEEARAVTLVLTSTETNPEENHSLKKISSVIIERN